ncbi:uncharacterized protein LOC109821202 [Asparagus officinalis]|uniref:uncharacterized protein LOC109821202 n=1 Tax=Asparagus officinalis TaxID=4686 RepID=UPI00098E50B1|nr:uncharacterized protein LOC109821202 [Asparagus officinalis]
MERAQFGGTSNVMNNEVSYGNMGPLSRASIEEDERSNDSGGEEQYSAPVDSMQFVTQDVEDNPEWPDEAYVNNDYVEYEEPPPDEFEDDEWIRSSTVKDMCIGESSTRRGDDDAPFKVGDLFETKDQLVDAIREYSFEKNFKFKQVKSNRTSYDAICFMNTQRTGLTEGNEADYSCPWKLYAFAGKKHNFQFRISEYCGVHTCVNPILEQDHSGASASYIARLIMPKLRKKLDLTPDNIIEKVLDTKFIKISYIKAWNARRIAMTKIFGDWDKSYATLAQYLDAIKRSNPGSEYKLITKEIDPGVHQFTSVFWVFGPSIEGFKFCRPILSIDGTHLYGKYKGVLLVATGVDADGGLFPLAFAVVEVENSENWEWMKGIPKALWRRFGSHHHHRYCLRHIRANFKKSFSQIHLQNLLWQAGCTPETYVYDRIRDQIKATSQAAHDWIERSLGSDYVDRWALSKDGGNRFCMMTTNCSESFNGVLKGARAMPIQALVARTFYRLNYYFVKRREDGAMWASFLTPKNEAILEARVKQARGTKIVRFAVDEWEVTDKHGHNYTVNLGGAHCTCTCNIPELQKLPCPHVIAVTSKQSGGANISYYTYASEWYQSSNYREAYKQCFHPVHDSRYWPHYNGPHVVPPSYKRQAGRPRSVRLKGTMDEGREGAPKKNRCGYCRQAGHRRSHCPTNPSR